MSLTINVFLLMTLHSQFNSHGNKNKIFDKNIFMLLSFATLAILARVNSV